MVDVSNYPTHKQTYEPIATQTLSSAASSVTFSNIPQTFKDLVVIASTQGTSGANTIYLRFNGDTATNYSFTRILGYSAGVISQRSSNIDGIGVGSYSSDNAVDHYHAINIQSYASTNVYKTAIVSSDDTFYVLNWVGLWRSTAAITSLNLYPAATTFKAGSKFSLYGIAG